MKLNEIKQIDVGGDLLANYWPEDEYCFSEWVTLSIGVKGEEGSTYFNLLVCTPEWISRKLDSAQSVWGRHMLIIRKYDTELIESEVNKKLQELLEIFTGDDDLKFSEKIARYAHWEYEDYVSKSL
ncbi:MULTISPECIES: immunity 8 family protein [unclassified Microbulbifer]|uniref:immunity 8 family protein n=1 Tax=unclassified Microbulbifer TaxID=2619833 RepID=UPI0027E523CD|nr:MULTISPECIES: immunity 8 family protein [unclassified Microbulbifer]